MIKIQHSERTEQALPAKGLIILSRKRFLGDRKKRAFSESQRTMEIESYFICDKKDEMPICMKLTDEIIFFILTWTDPAEALIYIKEKLSPKEDYEIRRLDDLEKQRLTSILKMQDTDVKFVDHSVAESLKNV